MQQGMVDGGLAHVDYGREEEQKRMEEGLRYTKTLGCAQAQP